MSARGFKGGDRAVYAGPEPDPFQGASVIVRGEPHERTGFVAVELTAPGRIGGRDLPAGWIAIASTSALKHEEHS